MVVWDSDFMIQRRSFKRLTCACMGVEGEGEELGRVGRGKLVKREAGKEGRDRGMVGQRLKW